MCDLFAIHMRLLCDSFATSLRLIADALCCWMAKRIHENLYNVCDPIDASEVVYKSI